MYKVYTRLTHRGSVSPRYRGFLVRELLRKVLYLFVYRFMVADW